MTIDWERELLDGSNRVALARAGIHDEEALQAAAEARASGPAARRNAGAEPGRGATIADSGLARNRRRQAVRPATSGILASSLARGSPELSLGSSDRVGQGDLDPTSEHRGR